MKPEFFDIQLDAAHGLYQAGQTVTGAVVIRATQSLKLVEIGVRLHGEIQTSWVNKTSDKIYDSRMELLNQSLDLTNYLAEISDGELLPEGTHKIPFKFALPLNIPSSIFNEYYGWARYVCAAKVKVGLDTCLAMLGGSQDFQCEKVLTIQGLLALREYPQLRQPCTQAESVELVGCFRSHGKVCATITIPRSGFIPGESIPVQLSISNMSGKKIRRDLYFSLCQQLKFRAMNRYELSLYDDKNLNQVLESIQIDIGEHKKQDLNREISIVVPGNIPTSSPPPNTTNILGDGLITISYYLKLDLDLFELVIPIMIGSSNPT